MTNQSAREADEIANMRVLIIGGTGFIGTHTARALVAAGRRVAVLHRGQTRAQLPETIEYIQGNRDDLASTAEVLRRWNPDVVVDMVPLTEEAVRRTIEWDRANPPQTRPSVADYEAEDRALTQVLSSES